MIHNPEWGVPLHDDRRLFEFLILEGAQAGLSLAHDPAASARTTARAFVGLRSEEGRALRRAQDARLLADDGIVRNRLKIDSTTQRARVPRRAGGVRQLRRVHLALRRRRTRRNRLARPGVPASTPESDAMSKDLKKRGFRFVGSTICYAFMQACGLVDDDVERAFARAGADRARPAPARPRSSSWS